MVTPCVTRYETNVYERSSIFSEIKFEIIKVPGENT